MSEIHARPSLPVTAPRSFWSFAFEVAPGAAAHAERAALRDLCQRKRVASPSDDARHHVVTIDDEVLKWERHAEFTTYTWHAPLRGETLPFDERRPPHPLGDDFRQPGPLLAAIRLALVADPGEPAARTALFAIFDPSNVNIAAVEDGRAIIATDFRPDSTGCTRILVVDQGLSPAEAGALVQRLLEIETYRTLALFGLTAAQRSAPEVQRIERETHRLTCMLRETLDAHALPTGRKLLDQLATLTAALEADISATSYRFGASRAYHHIVLDRLAALGERPLERTSGWSEFLGRRLNPAMRTIETIAQRQAALTGKLARTSELLCTRVDVELEHQSRDLLGSMTRAARIQVRLQETVEGLSVAAISYYVVGLLHYLADAAREAHLTSADPAVVTGMSVPLVLVVVFIVIRGIRRRIGG